MFKKLCVQLLVLAVVVGPVVAQDAAPDSGSDLVTEIFKIEYGDVRNIADVISLFGGRVQPEPELRVIGWTGPKSQLPAVEAAIRSLDVAPVPEPNVELTVWFLMAINDGSGTVSVPASLDGVAVQLQDVFGYDSVRLIETTALRVRNGSRGELNGILPQRLDDDREARYEFGFRRLWVNEDESGRSIRLDGLSTGVKAPHMVMENGQRTTRYMTTGVSTDIDLRENQKAVIGKTSLEGGAETVFIVVTGTIIE